MYATHVLPAPAPGLAGPAAVHKGAIAPTAPASTQSGGPQRMAAHRTCATSWR